MLYNSYLVLSAPLRLTSQPSCQCFWVFSSWVQKSHEPYSSCRSQVRGGCPQTPCASLSSPPPAMAAAAATATSEPSPGVHHTSQRDALHFATTWGGGNTNEDEETEAWRGYVACPGTTWLMSGKDRLQTGWLLQSLSSSPQGQWFSKCRLWPISEPQKPLKRLQAALFPFNFISQHLI